jgi:ADP-ribose pyrophosphatase
MPSQRSARKTTKRIIDVPTGTLSEKTIVLHPDTAIAVPLLHDERIVMIRQYRPLIRRWSIECPGGIREGHESPEDTARRELLEEIGFEATNLTLLRSVFASFGYSTEQVFIYVATGILASPPRRRPDEHTIAIKLFPIASIRELLADQELVDAKTAIALSDFAAMKRIV